MDIEQLRAVQDPRERVTAAVDLLAHARAKAREHRTRRNRAAYAMSRASGGGYGQAVSTYRALGISKALFNRIRKTAQRDDWPTDLGQDPTALATRAVERVAHWLDVAAQALAIRDETTLELLDGEFGPPARNAELAALLGVTSARVAQLRQTV